MTEKIKKARTVGYALKWKNANEILPFFWVKITHAQAQSWAAPNCEVIKVEMVEIFDKLKQRRG